LRLKPERNGFGPLHNSWKTYNCSSPL
jgi:hypothetical protein